MRLSEALRINQQAVSDAAPVRALHLVCGFTPLHLETFLQAHVRRRFSGDRVRIMSGLFGDLEGNLQRAAETAAEGAVVAIEWADLDSRLGWRASAGWSTKAGADIAQQAAESLDRIEKSISTLASKMRVAIIAPTLPIAPLMHTPPAQAGALELELRCAMASFLHRIGNYLHARIVSEQALASLSPYAQRHDMKMELHAGFPFTIPHAAAVAQLAMECLFPIEPKKGLITDLDDTLWKGILGDVGVEGVSWCLDGHSQAHAIYQQLLGSLAESGVLVAIASKNDPELTARVFERTDVLLKATQFFPAEVNWGPKSESIARILHVWNVLPESVVFVDDSAMELAEVSEKFPDMECVRFPSEDPAGVVELVHQLRGRFGKELVREEDQLRLKSLRTAAAAVESSHGEISTDFLARLEAKLTLDFSTGANDQRAMELVNKTNQFNLNGRRFTEVEWRSYFEHPGAFLLTATYEDRFGPLGKIAALAGLVEAGKVRVEVCVMSCRAFARHIEFRVLESLYRKFGAEQITFGFQPTTRNKPLREFFSRFFAAGVPEGEFELSAAEFAGACPPLFQEVSEK